MEIIYSFNHYTESWIEVSSQPSSSSLSSADTDSVRPIGLGVRYDNNRRRRRRLTHGAHQRPHGAARATSTAGSSQEEYEESESESDRIMNSSNEAVGQHFTQEVSPPVPVSSASEGTSSDINDEDENSTALGVTNNEPTFTPQPNAFSHPPKSSHARNAPPSEARHSYFPASQETPPRPASNSFPPQRPRSHTPYNLISPSHQADHDAALRASLSTLLSCAAAARGLPKREQSSQNTIKPTRRNEPLSLHMVSESAMVGTESRMMARTKKATSSRARSPNDKGKRKASISKDRSETRKHRRSSNEELTVTPTLLTWVVSAGVVVLFSAISFSAGYAIGREVGKMESGMGIGHGGMGGKEVGRGLKRLRWGSSSTLVPA